jgi:5-methyltetrahydropteroyltriglutamate--homocysteine methyltransferase
MTTSTVLGFPRIGPRRELKVATEGHWAGRVLAADLLATARQLRRQAWQQLRDAGLGQIPSNHFSLYDQVLDTTQLVGAVPQRFRRLGGDDLATYFAMARGHPDAPAMEMTKWFDTNYHYIVPELGPDTDLRLAAQPKPLAELAEAAALGIPTRPVLVGPVTFLLLGKPAADAPAGFAPLWLLDPLLELYQELLGRLAEAGAQWVQLDEPAFVQDRSQAELAALGRAYQRLGQARRRPRLLVASYFDHLGKALGVLAGTPVDGLALDFTRAGGGRNLELLAAAGGLGQRTLVAGVVDGRNVWANHLEASLALLERLRGLAGELVVSSSCSLQHVPLDLDAEPALDPQLRPWLAFARQKLDELTTLTRGLDQGAAAIADQLAANQRALASRRSCDRVHDAGVRRRLAGVGASDLRRASPYQVRQKAQRQRLGLPPLPTTTIGSFPQTSDVRAARGALRRGEIDQRAYLERMRAEIDRVIALQQRLGLDVLVHGEPERNDMVQYFAEQLDGYAATQLGWVQSFGTRYVRPPILFGDVRRPRPMTLEWIGYAQSRACRPVKGMLTGPVTMLAWSFVRDDQPERDTAMQVALALREEVADLERAGVAIIQVDEPALREHLPLRRERHGGYLAWALDSFRLATCGVADQTQIHTHMCYSRFGEVLATLAALDADVASIQTARSGMGLLEDLQRAGSTQAIGPGVYDIHSPRVPPVGEMRALLEAALATLGPDRLWVNPDCGLKTRTYQQVTTALRNMVKATTQVRATLPSR